jgi:hypothetical protein
VTDVTNLRPAAPLHKRSGKELNDPQPLPLPLPCHEPPGWGRTACELAAVLALAAFVLASGCASGLPSGAAARTRSHHRRRHRQHCFRCARWMPVRAPRCRVRSPPAIAKSLADLRRSQVRQGPQTGRRDCPRDRRNSSSRAALPECQSAHARGGHPNSIPAVSVTTERSFGSEQASSVLALEIAGETNAVGIRPSPASAPSTATHSRDAASTSAMPAAATGLRATAW